jgi:hypothetical protein
VGLGAGEVLEEVAVGLRRDDAEVEAKPVVRDDGRLRLPLRLDRRDPVKLGEVVGEGAWVFRGRDDVEVANGLGATADGSRLGNLRAPRVLLEHLHDSEDGGKSRREQRPPLLRLLIERLHNPLLRPRTQPGK